jgi:hypothetical protein
LTDALEDLFLAFVLTDYSLFGIEDSTHELMWPNTQEADAQIADDYGWSPRQQLPRPFPRHL